MKNIRIDFTQEELEQVLKSCNDCAFLGHKWDDNWTRGEERELRVRILNKLYLGLGLEVKEADATSWTDEDSPHGEMSSAYSPQHKAA